MQSHKPSLIALQTSTSWLRRKSECVVAFKVSLLVARLTERFCSFYCELHILMPKTVDNLKVSLLSAVEMTLLLECFLCQNEMQSLSMRALYHFSQEHKQVICLLNFCEQAEEVLKEDLGSSVLGLCMLHPVHGCPGVTLGRASTWQTRCTFRCQPHPPARSTQSQQAHRPRRSRWNLHPASKQPVPPALPMFHVSTS